MAQQSRALALNPAAAARAGGVRTKLAMGLVLGGVAVGALLAGPAPLFALLLILTLVAAGELFRLLRRRGHRPVPLVGFAAIGALFAVAYVEGERAPILFPAVLAGAIGATALVLVSGKSTRRATAGISSTMLVVVYLGLLGSYIVALRSLAHGFRLTLVFGLMTVLHDAGAYLAGVSRGRHRLAPSISPDKSWEGWAGGTALTFAVAAVAAIAFDPPFTWPTALALAALVSVAAPLGDLSESLLKRDFGEKDAGGLLPGHGGVLDRIDSVVFSAPIFFYAYRVLSS